MYLRLYLSIYTYITIYLFLYLQEEIKVIYIDIYPRITWYRHHISQVNQDTQIHAENRNPAACCSGYHAMSHAYPYPTRPCWQPHRLRSTPQSPNCPAGQSCCCFAGAPPPRSEQRALSIATAQGPPLSRIVEMWCGNWTPCWEIFRSWQHVAIMYWHVSTRNALHPTTFCYEHTEHTHMSLATHSNFHLSWFLFAGLIDYGPHKLFPPQQSADPCSMHKWCKLGVVQHSLIWGLSLSNSGQYSCHVI